MNTPNTSLYENYQAQYAAKLVGVDEALSHIRDGDVVGAGAAGSEPARLLERLSSLNGRVHGLKYYSGLGMRNYPFLSDPACRESFDVDCVFMMGPGRASHRKGLSDVYPAHLHNGSARWMEHNPVNVFMVAATPMDRHGYFRMSMCLIHEREMLEQADLVIVEVTPDMPVICGDTEIHISQVDYIVEGDGKMPEIPAGEPTAVEQAIGAHIAELVHDGDTIQLGIGGIPDAVGRGLMGKHDLGVHTEMITNSILDLVAAGVVTGRKKTLHRGKIVGAFTLGSRRLYDFLDQNPGILLMPGSYVNHPSVIAKNDNMVSINTTLNVDLSGQCASESIGSLQYSGSGGQSDTAVGALHAKGGRNIIAVKSVAHTKSGDVSAINAQLPLGSVVTLSRNDVDYIVTEYGVAPMRGRSVRERVNNLVAIAHPDFREQLRQDAQRLMLW